MDPSYWVTDEPKQNLTKETTTRHKKPSKKEETKQPVKEEKNTRKAEEKKTINDSDKKSSVEKIDASYWVTGVTAPTPSSQQSVAKTSTQVSKGSATPQTTAISKPPAKKDAVNSRRLMNKAVVPDFVPAKTSDSNLERSTAHGSVDMDEGRLGSRRTGGNMEEFEQYRLSYESDHEWNLRKAFIVAHHDEFPEDQLVCLANCFINSEVYGASYPLPVMEKLSVLKQNLGDIVKELEAANRAKRDAAAVKFVKASDPGREKSNGNNSGPSSHHHHHSHHGSGHGHHHHSSNTEDKSGSHHHASHLGNKSESTLESSGHRGKRGPEKPGSFEAALLSGSSPPKRQRKASETEHESNTKVAMDPGAAHQPTTSAGSVAEKSDGYKAALKNFQQAVGKHAQAHSEIDDKFDALHKKIMEIMESGVKRTNSVEFLHFCLAKVKMVLETIFLPTGTGQLCELYIDTVLIAKGEASKKKVAKHNACDNALELLKKPYFQVMSINPEKKELQASDTPFESPDVPAAETPAVLTKCGLEGVATRGMKRLHPDANCLENFVIKEPLNPKIVVTPECILRQSADFSRMKLSFDFREYNGETWCRILLEHEVLADMAGPTNKDAKIVASEKALEKLRQHCYTIRVKKNEDTDDSGLSREEVLGEITKSEDKIETGIGNKLLKMMGWTGGGIGKKGTGIAEPVKADVSVINRQGLGLSSEKGITPNFVKCIHDVISDYAKSNRQDDLKFAPTFSAEERAVIHKECHKFGLRTRSHGRREEQRYLVVSRKRTASELFSHILESGGSTSKYELIPPGASHSQLVNHEDDG